MKLSDFKAELPYFKSEKDYYEFDYIGNLKFNGDVIAYQDQFLGLVLSLLKALPDVPYDVRSKGEGSDLETRTIVHHVYNIQRALRGRDKLAKLEADRVRRARKKSRRRK